MLKTTSGEGIRTMALILSLVLLFNAAPAFARTLNSDERWSGIMKLDEDVTVPQGYTLTISAGTKIKTKGHQIISYGTVKIEGEKDAQVKFLSKYTLNDSDLAVFKVKPYVANTELLRDEFHVFKIQYAILWSIIFASLFAMIEAR
ncbi:MAG: hypothetical protein HQ596_07175 [Candidatus Saganbacteria bacterium]|nr:hypothetical protein [Candidatus Saganbacteria bacterium]